MSNKVKTPSGRGEELQQLSKDLRPYITRSLLFTGIASVLVLVPSAYMLEVYDRVLNSRSAFTLLMLTLAVVFVYLVMETLEWAHGEQMQAAGEVLDQHLGPRVFRATFQARLRQLPSGTAQPFQDLRCLREFLPSPLPMAVMQAPVAMVFLALLFAIDPLLGSAAVASALVQLLIAGVSEKTLQPLLAQAHRSGHAAQQTADGAVRNVQVVEAMGMLGSIRGQWLSRQREFLGVQAQAGRRAGSLGVLARLVQLVSTSMLLGLGAWLLLHHELPGGAAMMVVASILGAQVLKPLVQIITHWRLGVDARGAWQRVAQLLTDVPASRDAMPLPPPRGDLLAENLVVMVPGTRQPVVRDVRFALSPGEVLAVVGASGSGKTCLLRALAGLWPSMGGKARLSGADLHAWDKRELGPFIGYLPQDVQLFDGSIADNIARFGDAERTQVEAAAQAVGLHAAILALPRGYDTQAGPGGAHLSGGMRQRIGLARAMYAKPVLVLLDEPNASLDEAGDAALNAAIAQAKARGCTFVIVSHRTSVLEVVDKVLILKDGAALAVGSRDDVLAAMKKAASAAVTSEPMAGSPGTPGVQPTLAAAA